MKSNYHKKTIEQLVQDEVIKYKDSLYEQISADVVHQTLAACLLYLDKQYGFREKRLRDVLDGAHLLLESNPFGVSMDGVQALEYIKERYSIDIDAVPVKVSEPRAD